MGTHYTIKQLAADVRTLPIALAHYCAAAKPDSERARRANRLCLGTATRPGMNTAERVTFLRELAECRAARRLQRPARVA